MMNTCWVVVLVSLLRLVTRAVVDLIHVLLYYIQPWVCVTELCGDCETVCLGYHY